MKYFKVLSLLLMLAFFSSGFAQNQQIKKADKLYKLNEYSQAISLYEEGLKEEESLTAKTKLAYCYLMTNRLNNAEQLYSEIVHEERARPITKYYYGETLMSNGKYEEARNWFLKYADQNPADERALEMAKACEKVKSIKPLFENITINSFSQNSKSDDSGPVFYKDGIVFTSDRNSGLNPLKQKSGWTGRDFLRIYYSEADSTGAYKKPEDFSKKINELNKHCGPLSFNGDQNFIVFTRSGTDSGKNDTYNMQLYYSESNDGSKWKKPKIFPFCKKDHNYMHPALSADGATLYFVSDKPGGEGGTDIYKSRRTEKGWSTPLNLGTKVNTSFNEGFPFISSDDKLYFCSKGHPGYGGFDIFLAEQDDKGLWSKPRNIGSPVNSSFDDISFHLNDTYTKGVFSSSRSGNDDNIYTFEILPSTIVNTTIEESEEVYVRQALKPTNINENLASKEVDTEEEKITNQLKSETQNNNEINEIQTLSDDMPDIQMDAGGHNETEEKVETETVGSIKNDDQDEYMDNIDPDIETETENTETENSEESNSNVSEAKIEVEKSRITNMDSKNTDKSSVENKSNMKTAQVESEGSELKIRDERKTDITPASQTDPNAYPLAPVLFNERPAPSVYPFVQMKYLLKKGDNLKGKTFRINGIQFDKGKYIITPEIALKLNLLIDIMEQHPDLEVEIAAHTSSVGDDIENLEMSRARAGAIAAHLINRGIASDRINAEGYGENRLLNRCANNVKCIEKQHNVNERIELAIF